MKILNDILPQETNLKILDLVTKENWFVSKDDINLSQLESLMSYNTGLQNVTYQEGSDFENQFQELNEYAQLILDEVIKKLNIKTEPHRFFWNLYFTPSHSENHRDWPVADKCQTIIYNLHTTDGGTEIDGKTFKDKMGQAKIFESNLLHKGISCKEDKVRLNLNIIFKIK